MLNDAVDKVTKSWAFTFAFGALLLVTMWVAMGMFRANNEGVDVFMEALEEVGRIIRDVVITGLKADAKYASMTFPFFVGCAVGTLYGALAKSNKAEWIGFGICIALALVALPGLMRSFWSF